MRFLSKFLYFLAWMYGICIVLFLIAAAIYSHGIYHGLGEIIKGFLNPFVLVYFIPSIIFYVLGDRAAARANRINISNTSFADSPAPSNTQSAGQKILEFQGVYTVKEVHESSSWFGSDEFKGKLFKVINQTRSVQSLENDDWVSCFLDEIGAGNGSYYLSACKLEKVSST